MSKSLILRFDKKRSDNMLEKTKKIVEKNMIIEIVKVKQVILERPVEYQLHISSTEVTAQIGVAEIGDEAQEVLLLLILNSQNEINAIHRVFQGSLKSSIAHPSEIFRSALLNNGAKILIYHNHPSGNVEPSEEDRIFTNRIAKVGDLLGVELLDHIIVSDSSWYSFKEFCLL